MPKLRPRRLLLISASALLVPILAASVSLAPSAGAATVSTSQHAAVVTTASHAPAAGPRVASGWSILTGNLTYQMCLDIGWGLYVQGVITAYRCVLKGGTYTLLVQYPNVCPSSVRAAARLNHPAAAC